MKRVCKASVSSLLFLLLAAPCHAQSSAPPATQPPVSQPTAGFVSHYEIMRTLRAAGFAPLSPPLREGTTYVLRATDFRGILMHVVIDARTAAIRDATRIVPAPGRYAEYYGGSPYEPDDGYGALPVPATEASIEPSPPARSIAPVPRIVPDVAISLPPLPRPRPATLVSRKSDSVYPAEKPLSPAAVSTVPSAVTAPPVVAPPAPSEVRAAKPNAVPEAKSSINSEVITAAPPSESAATKKAPIPVEPLND